MTRKLTPTRLDEIEAAAKKATPGEWVHDEFGEVRGSNGESLFFGDAAGYALPISRAIAEHVAMMDPATTLALVAEVRELRAKVERVREVHRRFSIYETCPEDGCENAHCFETAEGDYVHDDDLVGHVCHECSDLSDEEPIYWPCDTIKALGEEA